MRIGYDCHTIGSNLGGNETYAYNLIAALARIDPSNEYLLYHTRDSEKLRALADVPNFRLVRIRPHTPYIRIPFALPLELARRPVDVLHVQYIPPLFVRTPVVNMIHDLASLYYRRFFTRREHWRNRLLLPWAARRALRLLTVSAYCKEQIVRTFRVPESKVVVTYNGIGDQFQPAGREAISATLSRYGITRPYLLFIGNIQPRKNLQGVLDAFVALKREHRVPHRLVVVGKKAWLFAEVFEKVRALALASEVTFTGYVPDADLPALYSGADVLVYPSFFEGFGLPPLEAMACGTPAVVSSEPAFPEVIHDAALMADPKDAFDIARNVLAAVTDRVLRSRLVEKGKLRAAKFTWDACARTTLGVLEEVAAEGRSRIARR